MAETPITFTLHRFVTILLAKIAVTSIDFQGLPMRSSLISSRHLLLAVALSASSALSGLAHAGTILGATGISASSGLPTGYSAPTALGNLIDQSGLSIGYVSGVTDFDSYTASTTACYGCTPGEDAFRELGGVASDVEGLGSITFDLGSTQSISGMAIWNQAGSASLNTFDLWANGSLIGSYAMNGNSQDFPQPASSFSFSTVTTQFVTMRITSNFGYTGGTILNEVAFESASAVPEPESYALALAGLAVLGLVGRRSRSIAAHQG